MEKPTQEEESCDAMQQSHEKLAGLSAQLNLLRTPQPRRLSSRIPLIGPLIVAFRRLCSWAATDWYVRPIMEQQNRFNEQVVRSLGELAGVISAQLWAQQTLEEQVNRSKSEFCGPPARSNGFPGQATPRRVQGDAGLDAVEPQACAPIDEEAYWEGQSGAGLFSAKVSILPPLPGEDDETYLGRFEEIGAQNARDIAPYHQADSKVLEIGCGIGRILKHVEAGERWGVDIAQGMLDWAKHYLAGQRGIHLVKTNGFDLAGVSGDCFDLVYSLLALQHVNKRAGFSYMRETHRVLRPGGRFFFEFMNILCDEGFEHFETALDSAYPLYFYTSEEARFKLQRAGLVVDDLYTKGECVFVVGHKPLQ